MKVSYHFKNRLQSRFNMDVETLIEELEYSTIQKYNKNLTTPYQHLNGKFKKYPNSELVFVENLNMCLVTDSNTKTLITVYPIHN